MLLLAGTYLSIYRETIPYRDKQSGEQTSWEKVELYLLDHAGRPHTLGVSREFSEDSLPPRGQQLVVSVRPSVFRNEVQLNAERVLSVDEARSALGQPSGLRAAEQKSA